MLQIISSHKICIISARSHFIKFVKDVFSSLDIGCVSCMQEIDYVRNSCLVILDVLFLDDIPQIYWDNLDVVNSPIVCVFSSETSDTLKIYAEKKFKYNIFFPIQKNIFYNYCTSIIKQQEDKNIINEDDENNGIEIPDSFFGCFAGNSKLVKKLRCNIQEVARNDNPVLLMGETGTGKTTGAVIIHKLSKRKSNELQPLNVSTVGESLAASAFFGTEKGAYTDATPRVGIFKRADKSTVFLDEIDAASLYIQAMLLTVIESGVFKKVGSDVFEKTDVRVICATNADLLKLMKEGNFREDLFYRLSGNIILFPSLRERKEDIPHIVNEFSKESKKILTEDAVNKLQEYSWPGNIRELKYCLERAKSKVSGDIINADNISFGISGSV